MGFVIQLGFFRREVVVHEGNYGFAGVMTLVVFFAPWTWMLKRVILFVIGLMSAF